MRQLAALFTGPRGASAAVPLERSSPPATTETICLFDHWPAPAADHAGRAAALLAWRERDPGVRLVAFAPGSAPPVRDAVPAETLALVAECEFLPDAMVLEGEWRERAADAHRIELWRDAFGGGLGETDEFLFAARRALFLHHHWRNGRGGVTAAATHLHAVGPRAWRCALILKWLGAAQTLSFYLAAGEAGGSSGLPGSALRRQAHEFVGGWIAAERKLAAAMGTNFVGDDAPVEMKGWGRWTDRVDGCR